MARVPRTWPAGAFLVVAVAVAAVGSTRNQMDVASAQVMAAATKPAPQTGDAPTLTANPRHGAVGTVVILDGRGCNNAGQPVYLAFEGMYPTDGMIGGADIFNIPVDTAQRLRTTFVIPATFHSLQGHGGGALRPGHYEFVSHPVYCQTEFVVDSVSLPRAGAPHLG